MEVGDYPEPAWKLVSLLVGPCLRRLPLQFSASCCVGGFRGFEGMLISSRRDLEADFNVGSVPCSAADFSTGGLAGSAVFSGSVDSSGLPGADSSGLHGASGCFGLSGAVGSFGLLGGDGSFGLLVEPFFLCDMPQKVWLVRERIFYQFFPPHLLLGCR